MSEFDEQTRKNVELFSALLAKLTDAEFAEVLERLRRLSLRKKRGSDHE